MGQEGGERESFKPKKKKKEYKALASFLSFFFWLRLYCFFPSFNSSVFIQGTVSYRVFGVIMMGVTGLENGRHIRALLPFSGQIKPQHLGYLSILCHLSKRREAAQICMLSNRLGFLEKHTF